jgi:hypothetical protein
MKDINDDDDYIINPQATNRDIQKLQYKEKRYYSVFKNGRAISI